MIQGLEPRLLRAAERFRWSSDKLRIVAAVLTDQHLPVDVARAEGLSKKRVANLVSEARNELYTQAVIECEPAAFDRDLRVEEDPLTKEDHAHALRYALDFEAELPVCLEAVEAVGAY